MPEYARVVTFDADSAALDALVNRNAMIVLVSPKSGIDSLADLIARVKEKPGALNYAVAGNGTLDHLVCEHLRASAGLDMVRINYGGVPKGITALMAGEVQVMVASVVSASSYVRSGQLKPIAVTSAQRLSMAPDAPTMTELGYKNFVMYSWAMLFAPSGVPASSISRTALCTASAARSRATWPTRPGIRSSRSTTSEMWI